jgi:hypothetical protein
MKTATGRTIAGIAQAVPPHQPREAKPPQATKSAALESARMIFVDENGEGPGVRLRKAAQETKGLGK